MNSTTQSPLPPQRRSWAQRVKSFALLMGAVSAPLAVVSCMSVDRTVIAPPHIPGATVVGSADCASCHAEISKDFASSTHAKLTTGGANAQAMGCESCHGPASLHLAAGGGKGNIIGGSNDTCFECHLETRGEFSLPHAHPVLAGKMTCSDCHDPHKGSSIMGGGLAMGTENDSCTECHSAQKGPFINEHNAMREGCTVCHKAHGSVNAKMLTERDSNLCLKCHLETQTVAGEILIGGTPHVRFITRGTCWSAGCHEEVHGSHINPLNRY